MNTNDFRIYNFHNFQYSLYNDIAKLKINEGTPKDFGTKMLNRKRKRK